MRADRFDYVRKTGGVASEEERRHRYGHISASEHLLLGESPGGRERVRNESAQLSSRQPD
jgi:hypothetical protein